jgi:hypothetical protein
MYLYMSVSFSRSLNFAAERRLRNDAKTNKAGPLEDKQLSRLGNMRGIALLQVSVTALHWRTLRSDTQTDSTMFNFNVLSVRQHIRILPDIPNFN